MRNTLAAGAGGLILLTIVTLVGATIMNGETNHEYNFKYRQLQSKPIFATTT